MEVTITVRPLADLEAVIERGLTTFVEVGQALLEIREHRLYRESHDSFEVYCRERWNWSRGRADQMIRASEVSQLLDTNVSNEAQARELAPLRDDPESVREVWSEVQEAHSGKQTAADVRDAVNRRLAPTRRAPDPEFADDYVEDVNQDAEYEPAPLTDETEVRTAPVRNGRGLTVGMADEERDEYERRQRATVSFARSTSSLHALLQPAPEQIAQDWLPAENGLARIAGCEQLWTGPGLRELAGWLHQAAEAWEGARS